MTHGGTEYTPYSIHPTDLSGVIFVDVEFSCVVLEPFGRYDNVSKMTMFPKVINHLSELIYLYS